MAVTDRVSGGVGFSCVATRSYLPHLRVLAASLRESDPGCRLYTLIIDGGDDDASALEADNVVRLEPHDVGIDRREFHLLALRYDAFELSCALKPDAIAAVLERGHDLACHLDADLWVRASIQHPLAQAIGSGLLVTPHVLGPLPEDGLRPTHRDLLVAGAFNGGVVATNRWDFIDWWRRVLHRDCLFDPPRGLVADQRWLELGAVLFGASVLRDPTVNVGHWNLHERSLSRVAEGEYRVGSQPLRCFHFSGFSPFEPTTLSRHGGAAPRVRPADNPAVARLCEEYARALLEAGYAEAVHIPYRFDADASGREITSTERRLAHAAIAESEHAGEVPDVPDPFTDSGAARFRDWLAPRTRDL